MPKKIFKVILSILLIFFCSNKIAYAESAVDFSITPETAVAGSKSNINVAVNVGNQPFQYYEIYFSTNEPPAGYTKIDSPPILMLVCGTNICTLSPFYRPSGETIPEKTISLSNNTLSFSISAENLSSNNYYIIIAYSYSVFDERINGDPVGYLSRVFNLTPSISQDFLDTKPELIPNSIPTSETSGKSITLSLKNHPNDTLSILLQYGGGKNQLLNITCDGDLSAPCQKQISLPKEGLPPGNIAVILSDNKNNERGSATLTITGRPEDRPGLPVPLPPPTKDLPDLQDRLFRDTSFNPCELDSKGNPIDPRKCSSAGGQIDPTCIDGILTAIGCIHTKPQEFVKDFMKFAIGISGGLAFLMMLSGTFQMITSAGNPDALKGGQDRLTSAVIGLMIVIFATLLLQIIGVNILGIFPP